MKWIAKDAEQADLEEKAGLKTTQGEDRHAEKESALSISESGGRSINTGGLVYQKI